MGRLKLQALRKQVQRAWDQPPACPWRKAVHRLPPALAERPIYLSPGRAAEATAWRPHHPSLLPQPARGSPPPPRRPIGLRGACLLRWLRCRFTRGLHHEPEQWHCDEGTRQSPAPVWPPARAAKRLYLDRNRGGSAFWWHGRFQSSVWQIQSRGFDAAGQVDLLGNLEGGVQLGNTELLHELVALGLLFGLGLRKREVQARRHGAEKHFHT